MIDYLTDFAVEGDDDWNEAPEAGKYEGEDLKKMLASYCMNARFTAPWCKLYKSSLIDNERFHPELSTQEDAIFNYHYLLKTDAIKALSQKNYIYNRLVSSSLSKKP